MIISRIEEERERQYNLPGSEEDIRNTPNEWAAIAGHYLFEEVRRGKNNPDLLDFQDNLIKAAAVILAALESIPAMDALGHFVGKTETTTFAETLIKMANEHE